MTKEKCQRSNVTITLLNKVTHIGLSSIHLTMFFLWKKNTRAIEVKVHMENSYLRQDECDYNEPGHMTSPELKGQCN